MTKIFQILKTPSLPARRLDEKKPKNLNVYDSLKLPKDCQWDIPTGQQGLTEDRQFLGFRQWDVRGKKSSPSAWRIGSKDLVSG